MPEDVKVAENETILLFSLPYLRKLDDLICKTPTRTIVNYIIWSIVDFYSGLLGASSKYSKNNRARALQCFDFSLYNLHIGANVKWVRTHFDMKSKAAVSKMTNSIKEELKETLEMAAWFDEETRAAALKKVENMKMLVAYPEEFLSDEKLLKPYENITIDETKFFETVLQLNKLFWRQTFQKLNKPIDRTDWLTHSMVTIVNAYYFPAANNIRIPAAFLQGGMFNSNWTEESGLAYLNYASLGFILGHEMTHGFDLIGCQYDDSGTFKNWWLNETKEIFENNFDCLVEQYSNFTDSITGLKSNGSLNLNENIADQGGLKLSYRSYKKFVSSGNKLSVLPRLNFTFDQIFWVRNAQVWCSSYTKGE